MTKYVYKTREYLREESLSDDEYLEHFNLPKLKFPKVDTSGVKKAVDSIGDNFNKAKNSLSKIAKNAGKEMDKATDKIEDTAKDLKKKATKTVKKLGKQVDREWKKHKWIARKRDKNGKWIYDYGNGFPGEKSIGKTFNLDDVDSSTKDKETSSNVKYALKFFDTNRPSNIDDTNQFSKKGKKFLHVLSNILTGAINGNPNAGDLLANDLLIEKKKADANKQKNNIVDSKTGLRLKKSRTSKEDDLAKVNPSYGLSYGTGNNNCYACALTYDLRRRGYDVTAVEDANGANISAIKSFYKNPNIKMVAPEDLSKNQFTDNNGIVHNRQVTNDVKAELDKEPDNSRGYMCLSWSSGGGHAVAYEKENGKTMIYDPQDGNKYELEDYCDMANSVVYFRTDNLEVNYDNAKKVVE